MGLSTPVVRHHTALGNLKLKVDKPVPLTKLAVAYLSYFRAFAYSSSTLAAFQKALLKLWIDYVWKWQLGSQFCTRRNNISYSTYVVLAHEKILLDEIIQYR
jgi:hypothetical protein